MKAMILAAGRGERMRPLTDSVPKPLICVADKPLIIYHVERLVKMGVKDIVINHAWLGNKLVEVLGDGRRWGARIQYSHESSVLETGGGIKRALPLLGEHAFLVINGDVFIDELPDFRHLDSSEFLKDTLAHLWLVDNPSQHPRGDFYLKSGLVYNTRFDDEAALTFSGMGIYHPDLFKGMPDTAFPLAPLLRDKMALGLVSGEYFSGFWCDVGTIERLDHLEKRQQSLDSYLGS